MPHEEPLSIFTIGHSTAPLDQFVALLEGRGIRAVVDIRTVPRSRRNPQFNRETLPESLQAAAIGYLHAPRLGGLRRPRPDSPNGAWRNASFRGFADYMQGPEFAQGMDELIEYARRQRTVLMCAEAVPWRCHRSLIADALVARGICVRHILGAHALKTHELIPWARVEGIRITYPAQSSPIDPCAKPDQTDQRKH